MVSEKARSFKRGLWGAAGLESQPRLNDLESVSIYTLIYPPLFMAFRKALI
jgi:hypothetical protein